MVFGSETSSMDSICPFFLSSEFAEYKPIGSRMGGESEAGCCGTGTSSISLLIFINAECVLIDGEEGI